MKYFILFTIISSFFISTYTQAFQRTSTINCNYCTAQGKNIKALDSAYINDQKIWVVDQQGTDFILDEYVVTYNGNGQIRQVDDFSVERINSYNESSNLSQTVSQTFITARDALKEIENEVMDITLRADDEFQSAFQVSTFSNDFAGIMSDRVMNDPAVKSQFDVIDAQIQVLKANSSIALLFLGTSLNLTSQIIVNFSDGTTAELSVVLTTSNGTNVKLKLKFVQARDKEGNIIPTTSSTLPHYRDGEILNAGNVGNMAHFANWFRHIEISSIEVRDVSGFRTSGGGSTRIRDCRYRVTKDSSGEATAQLICR